MWNRLAHAIGEVQNHKASTLSYEEHYRYAYNLVLVSVVSRICRSTVSFCEIELTLSPLAPHSLIKVTCYTKG